MNLSEQVRALETRLEVWAADGYTYLGIGDTDGIGCRNETIKLQDARIAALEARCRGFEARCAAAEKILRDAREELDSHWFSADGSYNNEEVIDLCERIDAFFRGNEPLKVGGSEKETAVEQVTYVNAIPPCSRCGKRVGLSIPRMGIKEAGDDICVCQAPETLFSSTVNRSSKP